MDNKVLKSIREKAKKKVIRLSIFGDKKFSIYIDWDIYLANLNYERER